MATQRWVRLELLSRRHLAIGLILLIAAAGLCLPHEVGIDAARAAVDLCGGLAKLCSGLLAVLVTLLLALAGLAALDRVLADRRPMAYYVPLHRLDPPPRPAFLF